MASNQEQAIFDAIKNGDAGAALRAYTAYVDNMTANGQKPKPASYFKIK